MHRKVIRTYNIRSGDLRNLKRNRYSTAGKHPSDSTTVRTTRTTLITTSSACARSDCLCMQLNYTDIFRSHPIGQPNRNGKIQIICRFQKLESEKFYLQELAEP
jgi:hypothetical protein